LRLSRKWSLASGVLAAYVGRDMANEFITNQLNDFQARIKGLRGSL
jgi:putative heme iron utilization protein